MNFFPISLIYLFLSYLPLCVSAQNSFSLPQALQKAKENNPVLKTQLYNIQIVQTDIVSAKLRPNPVLNNQSLQLLQANKFAENTSWYRNDNRQVWWQLTRKFHLPAQRRSKILFAEQNAQLEQKNYLENERNLLVEVAKKWLTVWFAQKNLEIVKIAKNNLDSLIRINQLRFEKQVIMQTELMRTQLLGKQYEIEIKTEEQNYRNELQDLRLALGVQTELENIAIDTNSVFIFTVPTQLDSLLERALTSRSDLLFAQKNIEVSEVNIQLQKALRIPLPEAGIIWNPQNGVPYLGIFATFELPIFSRNQGEIKKSFFLKQQSEQQLKAVEQKISTEIGIAHRAYQTQAENVRSYQEILQQSEQILKNVRYAYLRGGTTIIDFLEAQRNWLHTQQQYTQILFQYRQAYIELLYATGLISELGN